MKDRTVRLGVVIMTVALGFFLAGCATGPGGSAGAVPGSSQQGLLQQAGFKLVIANSPKMLNYIKTLPLNQVVSNLYHGHLHYLVRTNPKAPQCYIGDQAAYQRYQQLALQAALAAEQHKVSTQRWDPEALELYADSQGAGS